MSCGNLHSPVDYHSPSGGVSGPVEWVDVLNKPLVYSPSTHGHSPSDVAGTAIINSDSRLDDSRIPMSHDNTKHLVSYLPASDPSVTNARVPTSHTHTPGEVTGTAVVTNDGRLSDARQLASGVDKTKLNGIAAGAVSDHVNIANKGSNTHAQIDTFVGSKGQVGGLAPIGYALLSNDTLAQALATNYVTKLTVTANRTLTTTVPPAGVRCAVIILTSGGSSFTITFGAGFKPTGTLATGATTGRVFVVNFISDGTNLYEAGRTAAMVA